MAIRKIILIDLDGTIYTGGVQIGGAMAAINVLRQQGHKLLFLTNTDSVPSNQVIAKVYALGLDISRDELFTPVDAAISYYQNKPEARVLACTASGVRTQLANHIRLVEPGDGPSDVLVGDMGSGLGYSRLNAAFQAIDAGARLLALQKNRYYYTGGSANIDTGAIVAALEYATGQEALILGKPSLDYLKMALHSLSITTLQEAMPQTDLYEPWPLPAPVQESSTVVPLYEIEPTLPPPEDDAPITLEQVYIVGDDRDSDIRMGAAAGIKTILVRTGKYALQLNDPELPQADYTIDSIADLPAFLESLEKDIDNDEV